MQSIKQIRQQYGLTQQELADFLGISKGMLAMVETNKRSLSTASLLLLNQLVNNPTPDKTIPVIQSAMGKHTAASAKSLMRYVQNCSFSAIAARQKLENLQQRYQQVLHSLQLCHQIRKGNPKKAQQLWANMIEAVATKKLSGCGQGPQLIWQLKAEALEKQAKTAQRQLDEMQG